MRIPLILLALLIPTQLSANPGWVCWASPTQEAKEKCKNKCEGAGTYAVHPRKDKAMCLAISKCIEIWGDCDLDYCEEI